MAKQSWPTIRKRVYPNGSIGWIVDCRFDGKNVAMRFERINARPEPRQPAAAAGI